MIVEAENAYRQMLSLLLKVPDMRQGERAGIEAMGKELRFRLDHVPTGARAESHPASFAAGA